ncbi:hypothetical protein [Brevibacillus sp. 179-C9.3 HS]|uniref:hypothetical protein n=1 Tax=unclassified Brevibacillus TaxID=2684853 RepID=UPI0039A146F6
MIAMNRFFRRGVVERDHATFDIARVSGKSYDVYVKEHILEPADMPSSTFLLSDLPHLPDVTTIYHFKESTGGESEIYPDPLWEDGRGQPIRICEWGGP